MPFHEEFDYMPLIRCRIGYHQVFLVSVGIGCRLSHAQSIPKCQCWLTAANGAWESVHFFERKQGDKAYEILWGWGLWQKGQIKRANCRGVWRHSSVELCRCLFQSMVWKGQGGDVRWRGRGGLTRNHFLLVKTVLYQDSGRFFALFTYNQMTHLFSSLWDADACNVSPGCLPWLLCLGFPKVWPRGRWHWHCCGQEGHPEASFRAKTEKQYVWRMTYCVHHSSFLVLASSCFYPFNLKSPLESPLHMALSWSFRADWPTSHDMFLFCFLSGLKMIQQMRYGMTNLYRMSDLLFKWYTYNNTYHLINDVWEGMTYHMAWNFAWYDISHQTKITYHITFYAVECCSLFQ